MAAHRPGRARELLESELYVGVDRWLDLVQRGQSPL
jgi:hypothetical protein